MYSDALLRVLSSELHVALDVWTAAWLGESLTLKSYFHLSNPHHPDGANPDARNRGGWTPLLYACHVGHYNIIAFLLRAGADPNLSTPLGQSPLGLVATSGNFDCVQILVDNGANVNVVNKMKSTTLHLAAKNGHHQTVEHLARLRVPLNKQNTEGNTALLEATLHGHERAVSVLLNHGADIMIKNRQNHSAIDVATIQNFTRIRECLLSHMRNKVFHNGTDSLPSIHNGPQAFKNMINTNTQSEKADYQMEVLRRMDEMRLQNAKSFTTQKPVYEPSSKPKQGGNSGLHELLETIGMAKWANNFVKEDIDLHVFLTLDDDDLKKLGIKLFGPRRKMTTQINRVIENMEARLPTEEQAYADRVKIENEKLRNQLAEKEATIADLQQGLKQENQLRVVAENSWNDEQRINLQYEQLVGSMLARFNDLAMSAPTQKEKDIFVGLKRAVENTMRQKFCL